MKRSVVLLGLLLAMLAGVGLGAAACNPSGSVADINRQLGAGVNLGQALEAPREGDWGFEIEADFFPLIADAGFGHVRVPINWAAYADTSAPYLIPDGNDPTVNHPDYSNIWDRIDWVVDLADQNDLMVIINVHHYEELHLDPVAHQSRFEAIWEQIAERYAGAGDHVLFELLNEPTDDFTDDPQLWNSIFASALAKVRESNPDRPVLVGPVGFNSIDFLDELSLPDDPNLITTVHFYEPFSFTHQGATWIDSPQPTGTGWDPQSLAIGPAWNDYSWSTIRTPSVGELVVEYEEQWAGLNLNSPDTFEPETMTVEVAGAADLQVVCDVAGDDDDVPVDVLTSTAATTAFSLDLSSCPASTTGIFFQLASPGPTELRFFSGEVCAPQSCTPLFASAADSLRSQLAVAQAWGQANGRPMNVGEFGAFAANGEAPLADRAEWTAAVRNAAADLDMSMTYWEFGGGFGAYDPDTDTWIEPLRNALVGN